MTPADAAAIVAGVVNVVNVDAIELCARCLADAAAHDGSDDGLTLAATALAADLISSYRDAAGAVLEAASREAAGHLDASELDRRAFAVALVRLACLRLRVAQQLSRASQTALLAGNGTPS